MDAFGTTRKRGRLDAANGGFAGSKRPREVDAQSALGSKSKPCTKFFSTSGCPFGEGCHFLHFVPGGYSAMAHMSNMGTPANFVPPARGPAGPSPVFEGRGPPQPAVKTKMCNKYNSAEGCKFGDKCHFAHGERELGKEIISSREGPMAPPPMGAGRMGGRFEQPPPSGGMALPGSFGASATAKISVDASLAGAIIGKGGVNTKHICRFTGVKLAIRDHDSDATKRNIELEGTFDQISQASSMVQDLLVKISESAPMPPMKTPAAAPPSHLASNNFKTKLCDNFTKGTCTFGDRCHFAHGVNELRKAAV